MSCIYKGFGKELLGETHTICILGNWGMKPFSLANTRGEMSMRDR